MSNNPNIHMIYKSPRTTQNCVSQFRFATFLSPDISHVSFLTNNEYRHFYKIAQFHILFS